MPHRTHGGRGLGLGQHRHGQHDRADLVRLARDADERGHRRARRPLLGEGQGDVLHALWPARTVLRELPRAELWQLHPRRPPEPGPDQRLPGLPAEGREALVDPQPLQGLCPRHAGRDLQGRIARIHRARALRRLARQRAVGRRPVGAQLNHRSGRGAARIIRLSIFTKTRVAARRALARRFGFAPKKDRRHDFEAGFPAGDRGGIGALGRVGRGQLVEAGGATGAEPGPAAGVRGLRQRHPDPYHRHPRAVEADLVPRTRDQPRRRRRQGPAAACDRGRFPQDVRYRAGQPACLRADLSGFRRTGEDLWPDGRPRPLRDRHQRDPRRAARCAAARWRRHLAGLAHGAQDQRAGHGQRDERAEARRDDLALGVHPRHRPRDRDCRCPALPVPRRQHLRCRMGRARL